MEGLESQYLSASAGSGKTFALSRRFCRLVMAGVPPETICALTFTRAATREIFAAVVERLVKGEVAPEPGWLTCEEALGRVLEALPRLQISTIDAFSACVARLFAYELGLSPDFTLYEEGDGPEAAAMLRETVRRALRGTPASSSDELLRLFDVRYDGGATARGLSERLRAFIGDFGEVYRAHPEGWGALGPLGDLPPLCPDREEAAETLRDLPLAGVSDAHGRGFMKIVANFHPELASIREWKAVTKAGRADLEKIRDIAESGVYSYYRKELRLGERGHAAFRALWLDLLGRDVRQTAAHTARLRGAVAALAAAGDRLADETGRLTFGALTQALARRLGGRLSVMDEAAMYVAYRMDTAVRHLMIDEFQDTSVTQWEVLSSLARELACGEDSTFFYVGDVKQSIYGWRGGDVSLFGDAKRVPDVPAGEPLVESFRSSPAVIECVNRVFGFTEGDVAAAVREEPWQGPALKSWVKGWERHKAHRSDASLARCVVLRGRKKEEWLEALAGQIEARWRELRGKRLKIAVLAFQNALLKQLQERLRDRGVPCAIDGKTTVAETPMGRLVCALLHWVADPRATLWGEVARRLGLGTGTDAALLTQGVRQIAERGYAAWLDACFAGTPAGARLTGQDREGLAAIHQCLEALDARGGVDPAEALDAVRGLALPSSADSGVISLMTVHHSKGLTFDVVFTLLNGDLSNDRAVTCEMGEGWVLEEPTLAQTAEVVPALHDAVAARRARRFRDDLCALYVALTRAGREQIIFVPEKEASKPAHRAWLAFRRLAGAETPIGESAAEVYVNGDPDWWRAEPDRMPVPPPKPREPWERKACVAEEETELPSERARAASVADLLAEGADLARRGGLSQHARLAALGWVDDPPCFPDVFRRPGEPCELWRERPFAVSVREGGRSRRLVGQFDRVHLFPQSRRAEIYDFKTGRGAAPTPDYERQLRDYRRALAVLTGFDPKAIRMTLLFTRSGRRVEVADA